MLVLTRKRGESIMIGDNIKITVSKIKTRRIEVTIEAPKETKVIRGKHETFK